MIWFPVVLLVILVIVAAVALMNITVGPFLKNNPGKRGPADTSKKAPLVSLLVPARNEEKNIVTCLEHLQQQDYANFEILVIDDQSTDETAGILKKFAQNDARISWFQGQDLPPGWTGKNWACQQLGQIARGDILIFTDADTQHAPNALSQTVLWMQEKNLDMLSAFPQQLTWSWAERLIVPIIDFFVYGLLPLWATYYSKSAAFSAANGQWIAFTRPAYRSINGHAAVKNQVVEDIELFRHVKKSGLRALTLAGTKTVYCRMYHSPKEVWHGFSKNFFGLTGHNPLIFLLISFLLFGCCVLPYLLLALYPANSLVLFAVFLNIFIRLALALRYHHPLLTSTFLHPVAIMASLIIGINSYYSFYRGAFVWKDRKIQARKNAIT